MTKAKPKKRKVRRVVLGVGHPWFLFNPDHIGLTEFAVDENILLRRFDWQDLQAHGLSNQNRIRLVAEVLK